MTHLKYRLILELADGTTKTTHTGKRRKIVSRLHGDNWLQANLTVVYYGEDGQQVGTNSGYYDTLIDALDALSKFTEAELIQYIEAEPWA